MGLIAYTSHDYQILFEHWLEQVLMDQQSIGPHESTIIVPNHRIANWLSHSTTRKTGVSMNFRFTYFDTFATKLAETGTPDKVIPERLDQTIEWTTLLYEGLQSGLLANPFSADGSRSKKSDLQWMQLAWEYARIFQLYAEHRPSWLEHWKRGDGSSSNDTLGNYQARVFRYLTDHQASNHSTSFQNLKELSNAARDLETPLYFFGFWNFTKSKWMILQALAEHSQCKCYCPFPSSSFLVDITRSSLRQPLPMGEDNVMRGPVYQLIARLGQRGRAMQMLFLDDNIENEDLFVSSDQPNNSKLRFIKSSLLDPDRSEENGLTDSPLVNQSDCSMQVHRVCSVRREVEVAKDIVYRAIANNPSIALEDIHVHAPDISVYASTIESVFTQEDPEDRIGFSIQNSIEAEKIPGVRDLIDTLKLLGLEWTGDDFSKWLAREAIRTSFGLSVSDVEMVREWIQEAAIFKGGYEAGDVYNWANGFKRLVAAWAIDHPDGGKFRHPPDQHSSIIETLAEIADFLLEYQQQIQIGSVGVDHFRTLLLRISNRILKDSFEFEKQVMLSAINRVVEQCPPHLKLEIRTCIYLFKKSLPKLPPPEMLSRKTGVQFSSIQAEEVTPAKIRILMGMSEGEFPASDIPQSHNLMDSGKPEANDPSRKEDQRYWLLHALHQTTEQWAVIFQGQDASGKSVRGLSPAIQSIVEACNTREGNPEKVEIIDHPRFGYDAAYFSSTTNSPLPISVTLSNFKILEKLRSGYTVEAVNRLPELKIASDTETVKTSVWQLAKFFSHPNKYVCENYLKIRFSDLKDFYAEHEPLLFSGLKPDFSLKTDLIAHHTNADRTGPIQLILNEHHHYFPEKLESIAADLTLRQIEVIKKLPPSGSMVLMDKLELRGMETTLNNTVLSHLTYANELEPSLQIATIQASDPKPKHELVAWIHMLAVWNSKSSQDRREFSLITNKQVLRYSPPHEPESLLCELLEVFLEYQHQPVPFFPATSLQLVKDSLCLEAAAKHATWEGPYGDKKDPHNEWMFRDSSPFTQTFVSLAERVWKPVLAHKIDSRKRGGIE